MLVVFSLSTMPFIPTYRMEPSVKRSFVKCPFASWQRRDVNTDSMIAFLKQASRLHLFFGEVLYLKATGTLEEYSGE